MNYLLTVKNEKINKRPDIKLFTGNIGTYTFSFVFDELWQGLTKFVSFTNDSDTYIVQLEDDAVAVPSEILEKPGLCSLGVYGTNTEDIKRLSSNILEFEVMEGAYSEGHIPKTPTPDVWESLFKNSIPKIIDEFWHIYSIEEQGYVNTGVKAIGNKPQKYVDYFTDSDKAELTKAIEDKIIGDIDTALDNILAIQNELIGGDSV